MSPSDPERTSSLIVLPDKRYAAAGMAGKAWRPKINTLAADVSESWYSGTETSAGLRGAKRSIDPRLHGRLRIIEIALETRHARQPKAV